MMQPPERSPERDAAIDVLLPNVPFDGWTLPALRRPARRLAEEDAELLFPGGAPDMIEAFCDLADRRMEEGAAALDMDGLRTPARVRAVMALRLRQNRPHKEAVRRALAVLFLPRHAPLRPPAPARTVDAIWHAAGDRSADFSWYTKRAILAGVYSTRFCTGCATRARTTWRRWPFLIAGSRASAASARSGRGPKACCSALCPPRSVTPADHLSPSCRGNSPPDLAFSYARRGERRAVDARNTFVASRDSNPDHHSSLPVPCHRLK